MKRSAGLLLYRPGSAGLEVLLVHPSGNYNRKKPWSIPKGESNPGETNLETTARRETWEETGIAYADPVRALGTIRYKKSGKEIHAFAGLIGDDAKPRCASWEVDRAEFVSVLAARSLLHPEQAAFLDRLSALLDASRPNA